MGDWLKMCYYGRTKPSKAKELFATCNFLYSLLLFATWYLCNHPFNKGERLLLKESNTMRQRLLLQMLRSGVLSV